MYQLIVDKKVAKFIDKLDKPTRKRILNAFLELKDNPYTTSHVKKLQGHDHYYRKRVGDYRIIYSVQNNKLIVSILKVDSRGGAYKK